jgi:putative ABC transport system permease protein
MHVRTMGIEPTASVVAAVRDADRNRLEKNLPTYDIHTMREQLGSALFGARVGAILLVVFGALALLLASVGLYGVMGYSVARRTREIGVRMALGATRCDVLQLILKDGMALVGIGVGAGVIGAWFATRLLTGFLYDISTTDPLTFVVIALLLIGVALGASFVPAYRATRVDPLVALRYE